MISRCYRILHYVFKVWAFWVSSSYCGGYRKYPSLKCFACHAGNYPCVNAVNGCPHYVLDDGSHKPRVCTHTRSAPCPFGPSRSSVSSPLREAGIQTSSDIASGFDAAKPLQASPDPVPQYIKCARVGCFTLVCSISDDTLCSRCDGGSPPCQLRGCTRLAADGSAWCIRYVKKQCVACVEEYRAGHLSIQSVAQAQRGIFGNYCNRHAPAAARLKKGLKRKPRAQVSALLKPFVRMRINKKRRRPSTWRCRALCQDTVCGKPCTERAQKGGRCKKHATWITKGRSGLYAARISFDEFRDALVPRHCLNRRSSQNSPAENKPLSECQGRFGHSCSFCHAQHFSEERIVHGGQLSCGLCCSHGKLQHVEPVPAQPYPVLVGNVLQSLLRNVSFKESIRQYNGAVSFVGFSDNGGNAARHLPGHGPYTYAIQGQVFRSMSSLDPPPDRQRAYGQMYFYDPDVALEARFAAFDGLDYHLLQQVQTVLYYDVSTTGVRSNAQNTRSFNPYVGAFRHMYALLEESKKGNRQILFQFQTGTSADPRRYNAPLSGSEVDVLYDGERPPTNRGIFVYPSPTVAGTSTHSPSIFTDHIDPLTYPLLFPDGQKGWHPNLKYYRPPSLRNDSKEKISMAEFYSHRLMQRDPLPPTGPIVNALLSTQLSPPRLRGTKTNCDMGPPVANARSCLGHMPHAGGKLFQQYCVDVAMRLLQAYVVYIAYI